MSVPPYPSYKDSGVEWLGKVPSHWSAISLKRCCQLRTEKAEQSSKQVALEHLESWTGRLIQVEGNFESEGTAFAPGDILYGKLRPYLAKVYEASFHGSAVGDFHVLRPDRQTSSSFLRYTLLTPEAVSILNGTTFGSRMPRVSWDALGSFRLPMPPPREQTAITAFLDRETAKIDALVDKQRQLIVLLKEKRRAAISHAVTKGLDPSAPKKDSGVAWLGNVPAHWDVSKFRAALKAAPCYGVLVPDFEPDGVPMLRINDMTAGVTDKAELRTISKALSDQFSRTLVEPGDLLLSVVGTIGSSLLVGDKLRGANLSRAIARLTLRSGYSAAYVQLIFSSLCFTHFVDLTCVGSAQRVLNMEDLSSFRFCFPPLQEQEQICRDLKPKLESVDRLIAEVESAIALFRERRAALVLAAVTGKVDVRDLAVAEAEAA